MRTFTLLILLAFSLCSFGQRIDTSSTKKSDNGENNKQAIKTQADSLKPGKISYNTDKSLKNIEKVYRELKTEGKGTPGYRVQIHFGSDIDKANVVMADFILAFPETSAYKQYDAPNFRVRVGDFRTRLKATEFKQELKTLYPYSFVVQDMIIVDND